MPTFSIFKIALQVALYIPLVVTSNILIAQSGPNPGMVLDSVTFSGMATTSAGGKVVMGQDKGPRYPGGPHWLDSDLSGDATSTTGDRRFPLAFVRGTRARVAAGALRIKPPLGWKLTSGSKIWIYGLDSKAGHWSSEGELDAGRIINKHTMVSTQLFGRYDPSNPGSWPSNLGVEWLNYAVNWAVYVVNPPETVPPTTTPTNDPPFVVPGEEQIRQFFYMGGVGSDNRVSVLLDKPAILSDLPGQPGQFDESVVELSCKGGAGTTDMQDMFNQIHDVVFSTRSMRRKAKDGFNIPDNEVLKYYAPIANPTPQNSTPAYLHNGTVVYVPKPTYPPLIEDGNGQCGAFAQVGLEMLVAHGFNGANAPFAGANCHAPGWNQSSPASYDSAQGHIFVVKNSTVSPSSAINQAAGVYDASGFSYDGSIPAQGAPAAYGAATPSIQAFNNHCMLRNTVTDIIFDISYGVKKTSKMDWELSAIDGYFYYASPTALRYQLRLPTVTSPILSWAF